MGKGGSGGQVAGYRYYMAMLMGMCRGPVDEVVQINVGDMEAWSGSVTSTALTDVTAPNLFGGDTAEGGVQGQLSIMMGEETQDIQGGGVQAAVTSGVTAVPASTDPLAIAVQQASTGPSTTSVTASDPTLMGSLRGVLTMFFNGLICSNNPYPKKWTVRVRRALQGWHGGTAWYPDEAIVALTDEAGNPINAMNPAHILYECLTNPVWGRGLPADALDEPSFISAANTLCREQFGLCMKWSRSTQLADFMSLVVNHMGAAVYVDRVTGLLTMRLIRQDYTVEELPVFDYSSGLLEITDDQTTAPDNSHSEIIINWVDPVTGSDRQTRIQNLAGTQANQTVTSTAMDFLGIPTASLAARIGQREMSTQGPGIKRFTIKFDRRGRKIEPAGVFRISVPDRNISNMVLRAGKIEESPGADQTITVVAVQDVFGLESTTYLATPERTWVQPAGALYKVGSRRLDELTYRDTVRLISPAELALIPVDTGGIATQVRRPSPKSWNYELNTHAVGEAFAPHGRFTFTPTGALVSAISYYDTSITLTDLAADTVFDPTGTIAWLEDELVEVTSYDPVTLVLTIGRGCVDTIPQPHASGVRIWFPDPTISTFAAGIDGREYTQGETVSVKELTTTASAIVPLSDADTDTIEIVARQGRPYPPGDFQIDGTRFADVHTVIGDIPLTWTHRDRITQADNILVHGDGSTGPETSVTYETDIYTGMSLLRSTTGITGDNWTYDTTMATADGDPGIITLHLRAERDSVLSFQEYVWTIRRTNTGYGMGYGYSYGKLY